MSEMWYLWIQEPRLEMTDSTTGATRRISLDSWVAASDDQVHHQVGGEALILGLTQGTYYGMNQVGTRTWELLQEPIVVASIRDKIVADFEVDPDDCARDLLAFLTELLDQALIELRPCPATTPTD